SAGALAAGNTGTSNIRLYGATIAAATIGLYIKGATSQTGDLIQINSVTPTILGRFNKDGYFMTRLHAAPADADVATGELAIWFDQTIGATKAMFKGKDSGGTVRTATVAMA